jgi:hypothetical protein
MPPTELEPQLWYRENNQSRIWFSFCDSAVRFLAGELQPSDSSAAEHRRSFGWNSTLRFHEALAGLMPVARPWATVTRRTLGYLIKTSCVVLVVFGVERGIVLRGGGWNGMDPFHAPVSAASSYGSGDLDGNRVLNQDDLDTFARRVLAKDGISGRMDLDWSGAVDEGDWELLRQRVVLGLPPSGWDTLRTREQRTSAMRRLIQVDGSDRHPYNPAWLQCVGFATEVFLNFAQYNDDLFASDFGAGGSRFNVPVYAAAVSAENFYHVINAVLVGDDPLQFDDWFFFEPQTDEMVRPGAASLPRKSVVSIYVPRHVQSGGHTPDERLRFEVGLDQTILVWRHPEFRLTPAGQGAEVIGETGAWNSPLLVRGALNWLLSEGAREDVTGVSDIHRFKLSELPGKGVQGVPLVRSSQFARPLDVQAGRGSSTWLLWKGDPSFRRTLSVAVFDTMLGTLGTTSVIAADRSIFSGRILPMQSGQVHVFWLELKYNVEHPHESGIYWSRRSETGWALPVLLVPVSDDVSRWVSAEQADQRRQFFDVAEDEAGHVVLVWARRQSQFGSVELTQRLFDGEWSTSRTVHRHEGATAGLDLETDDRGAVHLVTWSGPARSMTEDGRGILRHRMWRGGQWSVERLVDADGGAHSPRLFRLWAGQPGLVWDKRQGGLASVALASFDGRSWNAIRDFPITQGTARYPVALAESEDSVVVSWGEVTAAGSNFRVERIHEVTPAVDGVVVAWKYEENGRVVIQWWGERGWSYSVESKSFLGSLGTEPWKTARTWTVGVAGFQEHVIEPSMAASSQFVRVVSERRSN